MLPSGSMSGASMFYYSGVLAKDGIATFRKFQGDTEDGGSKFRGCCYFETTAPS